MPELPEVETIRRTLIVQVQGLLIKDVRVLWAPSVIGWEDQCFASLASGRRITGVERRGKYLLIALEGDLTMIAHMRMTGRLLY